MEMKFVPPAGSISTFKNLGASAQLIFLKLPVIVLLEASPTTMENMPCVFVTTVFVSTYSGVASTLFAMIERRKLILDAAIIVPFAERATPWKLIPWACDCKIRKVLKIRNILLNILLYIIIDFINLERPNRS